jgi:class 3 adenylate cyclase
VAESAEPGEIRVSATVRALVAGAGIEFSDRGKVSLKGVPEDQPLFAVVGA